jgi:hypothetical protein
VTHQSDLAVDKKNGQAKLHYEIHGPVALQAIHSLGRHGGGHPFAQGPSAKSESEGIG